MKILLTTTSFQDTPGKHHEALKETGFEVDTLRGPVSEDVLLPIIENYDGVICGDDYFTRSVLEKGKASKLKVLSKYGIGLDKIDLSAAEELGIAVTNCPGVNHITVAEHTFALILAFYKNIPEEINHTRSGEWTRLIGNEIYGKKLGVAGLGRIGKEILIRAKVFGMDVYAFDQFLDKKFTKNNKVNVCNTIEELSTNVDILSLNMNANENNYHIINKALITKHSKKNQLIVNTARGELVDESAIIYGLENSLIGGYATDVLEKEPMDANHPIKSMNNVLLTPHIGSRTYESVERQGTMAVENLVNELILKV
jgi:D-3-phosphoglycerate dehydrogenase / 2-oxoglutarate reductase